jgi:hypothetical protein
MEKARIGIYGSIPRESLENEAITSILGYDPFGAREVGQDEVMSPYSGRAHKFGIHFTVYDLFTPTNYEDVVQKVRETVSGMGGFDYSFSRFAGYVRGDYQGKSVYNERSRTVLGLEFDECGKRKLKELHEAILPVIQPYRAAIEPEFDKPIFRNVPALWRLILEYGAPYVLENYSPHLTLASGLDGSDETLDRLVAYLGREYGGKLLGRAIPLDRLYVFEEILGGKYDGYFRVRDEIKLARRDGA